MTRTNNRALANMPNNYVSVLDFGADPTGTTESTQAFANALAFNREIFVPRGKYVVNNIQIPSGTCILGERGTIQGETYPMLVTDKANAAVFLSNGSPSYIKISNIAANTQSQAVTGASFFRMNNSGVDMGQYLEFHDVQTYSGFEVSYDGYFIFCQWINCFDGYAGAPSNNNRHCFIRSAPDDVNASQIGQTNICLVRDCKVYRPHGMTPNRTGKTLTDGQYGVILSYGSTWSFINTDFESSTSAGAVLARGVKNVMFESCWFESIDHTDLVRCEDLPLEVGKIVTYPVNFSSCNFNLRKTTQHLISVETDSTPIPVGLMEWYQDRIVFDSCLFGSTINGGSICNESQQVLVLNGRGETNNSDLFPPFLDKGRFVATKDADGNLLNDTKTTSYLKIRRVGLNNYGDTGIGGWQAIDVNNDKLIAQMQVVGHSTGNHGEIRWDTADSSTLQRFLTATSTGFGRYLRLGATTNGIQFGDNTNDANALNVYEWGTSGGAALQVDDGTVIEGQKSMNYVRVGDSVTLSFRFNAGLSNNPGVQNVFITLPFTAKASTYNSVGGGQIQAINNIPVLAQVIQSTNTCQLFNALTGAAITNGDLDINNNNIKVFQGTINFIAA